jgi:hypothetical protein
MANFLDFRLFMSKPKTYWMGHRSQGAGAVTPLEITRGDELFAALDGHILATHEAQWELRVAGVHEADNTWWAQLIVSGPRQHAATFRTESTSAVDLLASVQDWLADCERLQPAVLPLARS